MGPARLAFAIAEGFCCLKLALSARGAGICVLLLSNGFGGRRKTMNELSALMALSELSGLDMSC